MYFYHASTAPRKLVLNEVQATPQQALKCSQKYLVKDTFSSLGKGIFFPLHLVLWNITNHSSHQFIIVYCCCPRLCDASNLPASQDQTTVSFATHCLSKHSSSSEVMKPAKTIWDIDTWDDTFWLWKECIESILTFFKIWLRWYFREYF